MKKEAIVSIVVIVAIFTINFFLQDYTKKSVETMTNDLNELKEELLKEDAKEIESKMSAIEPKWDDINHKMAFFIEHDELEKVKTDLVALRGYIEVKDYNTGVNELNKSIFVLEHISDKYDFNLVNIF